jgi:hypothetical protein
VATLAGVEYHVLVHGYQDAAGVFTLSMTCTAPCTPAVSNDDCTNAQALVPQQVGSCEALAGTNVCAYVSSAPNPGCDPYALIQDVWYSIATGPSATHTVTLTPGSSGPLGMALYSACGSGFIACYDTLQGPVVLNGLTTDATYYVQVWNNGGNNAGTFTICDEAPLLVGMNEQVHVSLRAWPVPASTVITVEGVLPGARSFRLVDAQGRSVQEMRSTGSSVLQMDVSRLSVGAYLLLVEGAERQSLRVLIH